MKDFKKLLEDAVYEARKEIKEEYEQKIKKMNKEFDELIYYNNKFILETIQTEFINELANQMNYWNKTNNKEDLEFKLAAKEKIEEINNNVFKNIEKYLELCNDKKAQNAYKKKKRKINKEFNLKIGGK